MNTLIAGLQWGDEGKGKAIDYLSPKFDVVVRFQGGHNAGHTIYHDGRKHVLHLLPSGIFSSKVISVIARGVVINPLELAGEMKRLQETGISIENLVISHAAPLILPFHEQLDTIFEASRYQSIGTTRRGIGPAYEDLAGRRSLFIADLLDADLFKQRLQPLYQYYDRLIKLYGESQPALDSYLEEYLAAGRALKPYVQDTFHLLHRLQSEGRSILFEGAQGTLLDIGHGTYPFVTSSHPTVGGVLIGTGLNHHAVEKVIGISKAYATRVGEGPFPTELRGAEGEELRRLGSEFGSTTGRPRRVGWLDLVALKYAVQVNGVDELFLTKLDVMDDFAEIKVCIAYDHDGKQHESFDPRPDFLALQRPVWRSMPGWRTSLTHLRRREDLPPELLDYLKLIENYLNCPVTFLSVGSGREETITLVPTI